MFPIIKILRQVKPKRTGVLWYSSGSEGSSNSDQENNPKYVKKPNSEIPSPPNNCCMSGCANCVWIQYADELSEKLQDGSQQAKHIMMKEVQDTNMRVFLEMELRNLERNKSE